MNFQIWELILCTAIIAFLIYAIWRGGSSNPVGTGQLQRQLNTIGAEVKTLKTDVGGCALKSDLEGLRGELTEMEKRVASSGEVIALQGQIATLNARIAGIEKLTDRTDATVTRIEDYLRGSGK
ncbi:hypothetical protein D1610_11595 [Sphingomonas gilva]|uniref:DUF2730 family protein n=1 Tax=Sphingomonas gilva TaxID=2305907 RepID=A0A396RN75_9SPHN|nr:hypothetical protein [Sphingomonas gilva]RHW17186.1 hypothetical protein D1610_11595 [Sphingomonas gilva]